MRFSISRNRAAPLGVSLRSICVRVIGLWSMGAIATHDVYIAPFVRYIFLASIVKPTLVHSPPVLAGVLTLSHISGISHIYLHQALPSGMNH
jgi:hypothetical protein